ncbi:MAG: hypothetical protein WA667_09285 [Candidatus Nitrosopolaris sp.]
MKPFDDLECINADGDRRRPAPTIVELKVRWLDREWKKVNSSPILLKLLLQRGGRRRKTKRYGTPPGKIYANVIK